MNPETEVFEYNDRKKELRRKFVSSGAYRGYYHSERYLNVFINSDPRSSLPDSELYEFLCDIMGMNIDVNIEVFPGEKFESVYLQHREDVKWMGRL
jgi:hypothetical protein